MAVRPAWPCWIAWFPVNAPSAATGTCERRRDHRRSAPIRASVCSTPTEPRSRTMSSGRYGRAIPAHRSSCLQLASSSSALLIAVPLPQCIDDLESAVHAASGAPTLTADPSSTLISTYLMLLANPRAVRERGAVVDAREAPRRDERNGPRDECRDPEPVRFPLRKRRWKDHHRRSLAWQPTLVRG